METPQQGSRYSKFSSLVPALAFSFTTYIGVLVVLGFLISSGILSYTHSGSLGDIILLPMTLFLTLLITAPIYALIWRRHILGIRKWLLIILAITATVLVYSYFFDVGGLYPTQFWFKEVYTYKDCLNQGGIVIYHTNNGAEYLECKFRNQEFDNFEKDKPEFIRLKNIEIQAGRVSR